MLAVHPVDLPSAVRSLDRAERALLSLSLRRGVDDTVIAEILDARRADISARRERLLASLARATGRTAADRDQVAAEIVALPDAVWDEATIEARSDPAHAGFPPLARPGTEAEAAERVEVAEPLEEMPAADDPAEAVEALDEAEGVSEHALVDQPRNGADPGAAPLAEPEREMRGPIGAEIEELELPLERDASLRASRSGGPPPVGWHLPRELSEPARRPDQAWLRRGGIALGAVLLIVVFAVILSALNGDPVDGERAADSASQADRGGAAGGGESAGEREGGGGERPAGAGDAGSSPSGEAGELEGTAAIEPVREGFADSVEGTVTAKDGKLTMQVSGLPPLSGGDQYQVWLYDTVTNARWLGTFGSTEFDLTADIPKDVGQFAALDISRERADGNENHGGASVARVPLPRG